MSDTRSLFKEINNTVLDLQSSDLQSYPRPLKKLGRLLQHEDLKPFNDKITSGVDLDAFIEAGEKTQGGMVGSATLDWPDSDLETLGLQLLLVLKFAENPDYIAEFGHVFYYTGSPKVMAGIDAVIAQLIIPFARDYKALVSTNGQKEPVLVNESLSNKVFIVHGHDGEARETMARYLLNVGLEPIILNEQANQGRTVIEKVEANSDVGFAVVLLTPDDEGSIKGGTPEPRARQNVLLELGYFIARIGRARVCALKRGDVVIPSDFAGVVWEAMDLAGGWKLNLARELEAAGYTIDRSKIR